MSLDDLKRAVVFLGQGQFRRVWNEVHVRLYLPLWECIFLLIKPFRRNGRPIPAANFTLQTKHPVAYESPDHIAPKGTAVNNSTNKKFVLHMDARLPREFPEGNLNMMDMGCAGGQLVADFLSLRWNAVGLEGSDFSLKFKRANWAQLATSLNHSRCS
jgi:hypothetical protein